MSNIYDILNLFLAGMIYYYKEERIKTRYFLVCIKHFMEKIISSILILHLSKIAWKNGENYSIIQQVKKRFKMKVFICEIFHNI